MKVKILRYQIDSDTKKKTIVEERDFETESDKQLTAKRARSIMRRAMPEWTTCWGVVAVGWPYLYKFRDERGKIFKASKAIGEPLCKGSHYHAVWEYVEIWEGTEKPKSKQTRKPLTARVKKVTASDVISGIDENPAPTSSTKA